MPKLDLTTIPARNGSNYPAPFASLAAGRIRQALGGAGGLADFGVNLTRLPPGAWSSQRHWHSEEDEFVYVISGELTLITNAGEQQLYAGGCAAFPKNAPDGHHMINRSGESAVYLEIGSRSASDVCTYPDIDLHADQEGYSRKNGQPYPT
jgi:uncharacterized cupin superfamily protein